MKSYDEILDKLAKENGYSTFAQIASDISIELAINVAREAAERYRAQVDKQQAVEFAEWCDRNEFTQSTDGLWYTDLDRFEVMGYTTAELYDIFNKENQEK